ALLHLLDAAELDQGMAPRLGCRHAGAQVVLGVHLEVALQLLGQLPLALIPAKEPGHADGPAAQLSEVHHDSLARSKKRARMSAVCSHSRVSRTTCLRPARVSL